MRSLEVKKLWWGWMGAALCLVGCGGSAKDDCNGACKQLVSCSGVGSEQECESLCSDMQESSSRAGCDTEFGEWAGCAASVDQCSATADCQTEYGSLTTCFAGAATPDGAGNGTGGGSAGGALPGATDPCIAYCEEGIADGCASTTDCATDCASLDEFDAACNQAMDALFQCLLDVSASVCALEDAPLENCTEVAETFSASCGT